MDYICNWVLWLSTWEFVSVEYFVVLFFGVCVLFTCIASISLVTICSDNWACEITFCDL
jgi:hypothetical protein